MPPSPVAPSSAVRLVPAERVCTLLDKMPATTDGDALAAWVVNTAAAMHAWRYAKHGRGAVVEPAAENGGAT